jgi:hypothetical protein
MQPQPIVGGIGWLRILNRELAPVTHGCRGFFVPAAKEIG